MGKLEHGWQILQKAPREYANGIATSRPPLPRHVGGGLMEDRAKVEIEATAVIPE